MITIVTTFKAFKDQDETNQLNALSSWRALGRDVEIIAFGESPGLQEHIESFGIRQIEVPFSNEGLPRIDAILTHASAHARHELIVYVNGDVILFDDFVAALASIPLPRFLMVGQRTDLDIGCRLRFSPATEREKTRAALTRGGDLHRPAGIDYFAFRRGSLPPLPPLYAGAAGWDNITIYLCRKHKIPVIDATLDAVVFHPNHHYRKLLNGKTVAFSGASAHANMSRLPTGVPRFYTTDASFWLDSGRLRSAWSSPRHFSRYVYTYPILRSWSALCRLPFRAVAAVLSRIGRQLVLRCWSKAEGERKNVARHERKRLASPAQRKSSARRVRVLRRQSVLGAE